MAAASPGPVDRRQLRADAKKQRKTHKEIERQIEKDRRNRAKEVDLLILGSSQAGKSTVVRQMQIIHGTGFSESELERYKPIIQANILWSLHELERGLLAVKAQVDPNTRQCDADVLASIQPLLEIDYQGLLYMEPSVAREQLPLKPAYVDIVRKFWNEPAVQDLLLHRNQFQLNDSTEYFLDDVQRLLSPGYLPTENDVLRVRKPTNAVVEHLFKIDNNTLFRVVDVSGQRTQRRKWIQFFEHCTAIIFVTSVIDYDLVMEEDITQNRMQDSRHLFKTIVGYPWFKDKAIILFLNKTDLLEKKILHSHLRNYLPSYEGPPHNAMAAAEYIRHVFLSANKSDRTIYTHFTRATDTGCMRFVLEAVRDIILQVMLNRYALV